MPTEQAQRKASERARKRALGLKRHEWWLEPAPTGMAYVPTLCYINRMIERQKAGKR